jgi:hypothetical protein
MGTRGYKVYRHKGRYYVYYNRYDSYPDGLGLKLLHEIPRNVSKEEFEEWVRKTREYVYSQRDSQVLNDPDNSAEYVSDKQPENDVFIEWIYEIDLDNLVFHVNPTPISLGQHATGRHIHEVYFIQSFRQSCTVRTYTRPISLRLACTTAIAPSRVFSRLQSL